MKAVKRTGKYNLTYRKKTASDDPYLPKGASRKAALCEDCGAVYRNKRWYVDEEMTAAVRKDPDAKQTVCPGCRKIRDNFAGGIVTLRGDFLIAHKQDLMNLIKNEEERARGFNPLERIISVKENGSGNIVVSTTNEKMAQRIGKAVKKAFSGDVAYHWSHDNKLIRVEWVR